MLLSRLQNQTRLAAAASLSTTSSSHSSTHGNGGSSKSSTGAASKSDRGSKSSSGSDEEGSSNNTNLAPLPLIRLSSCHGKGQPPTLDDQADALLKHGAEHLQLAHSSASGAAATVSACGSTSASTSTSQQQQSFPRSSSLSGSLGSSAGTLGARPTLPLSSSFGSLPVTTEQIAAGCISNDGTIRDPLAAPLSGRRLEAWTADELAQQQLAERLAAARSAARSGSPAAAAVAAATAPPLQPPSSLGGSSTDLTSLLRSSTSNGVSPQRASLLAACAGGNVDLRSTGLLGSGFSLAAAAAGRPSGSVGSLSSSLLSGGLGGLGPGLASSLGLGGGGSVSRAANSADALAERLGIHQTLGGLAGGTVPSLARSYLSQSGGNLSGLLPGGGGGGASTGSGSGGSMQREGSDGGGSSSGSLRGGAGGGGGGGGGRGGVTEI